MIANRCNTFRNNNRCQCCASLERSLINCFQTFRKSYRGKIIASSERSVANCCNTFFNNHRDKGAIFIKHSICNCTFTANGNGCTTFGESIFHFSVNDCPSFNIIFNRYANRFCAENDLFNICRYAQVKRFCELIINHNSDFAPIIVCTQGDNGILRIYKVCNKRTINGVYTIYCIFCINFNLCSKTLLNTCNFVFKVFFHGCHLTFKISSKIIVRIVNKVYDLRVCKCACCVVSDDLLHFVFGKTGVKISNDRIDIIFGEAVFNSRINDGLNLCFGKALCAKFFDLIFNRSRDQRLHGLCLSAECFGKLLFEIFRSHKIFIVRLCCFDLFLHRSDECFLRIIGLFQFCNCVLQAIHCTCHHANGNACCNRNDENHANGGNENFFDVVHQYSPPKKNINLTVFIERFIT